MGETNLSPAAVRGGFRGYVASRPVRGSSFPQKVQNLVVRDYAVRNGLQYLLSSTEYAMPACYLMLKAVLDELPALGGVICFSIFMLPDQKVRRIEVYDRILAEKRELHAALEGIALRGHDDIPAVEDLLDVASTLPKLPLGGRYEKEEMSAEIRRCDPFWATLMASL